MATYTEIPDGGTITAGCALTSYVDCIQVSFGVGDIAFPRYKAVKGKLERIAVKEVVVDPTGQIGTKIIDTYNALWFEDELVNHSTAIDLAREYHEAKAARIEAYLEQLAAECTS